MLTAQAFTELGLPPDATDTQVKAAWRRLVSRWHPDRNPSAQAVLRMQRINQAYEAIRGARGQEAGAPDAPQADAPPARSAQEPPRPADAAPPEDGPDARNGEFPHRPLRRRLRLTLEEAAAGCIRTLRGRIAPACGACAGRGHLQPAGPCTACRGKGSVLRPSAWFGWPASAVPCAACDGRGVLHAPCAACEGVGKAAPVAYQVQARIPAGVRDGDLLHVAARRARHRPAPVDIELQVRIAPHALLRLQADGDLQCELPVNGFAWMAQRSVQVPTLLGPRALALRRDRHRYRLEGLGFPRSRGDAAVCGDLVVDIVPVFPEQHSTDQDILLDQLIATPAGPRLQAWQEAMQAWGRGRRAG